MQLTREQILHVAALARIEISEEEAQKLLPDLNSILDYVKQLDEIDTKDIQPINQITGLTDIMEADEIKPFLQSPALLKCSPQPVKGQMIEVKKTI